MTPWMQVPGFRYERIKWEPAHTLLLGCGKDLASGVICDLVELPILSAITERCAILEQLHGVVIPEGGGEEAIVLALGVAFRRWCKHRKLACPTGTWHRGMIGRSSKNQYPELDSNIKACHTKVILFFLNELCCEIAGICPCEFCNWRANALYGMCDFLYCTDVPELRIPDKQDRCLESGMTSLTAYWRLSHHNWVSRRSNYKMRPKWHPYSHMVHDFQYSDENPHNFKTLMEEDFLGKITDLAEMCPGKNVLERLYQRYKIFLAMHWREIREHTADH